jgi:hypothetical protein
MSTEDIRIKIQADESGALNSFKRLRSEVLNNEQGLKKLSQQGKMTSTALKDMASFVGPEFQILGDRLDHITGAMGDIKGASLAAKAGLAALVAVGAFEVGKMLGEFIFQTEQWKTKNEEAVKSIVDGLTFVGKQSQDRFNKEMQAIALASDAEQKRAEAFKLRNRITNQQTEASLDLIEQQKALNDALANDVLGYGQEDNAIAQQGVAAAKERVAMLQQQRQAVEDLLDPTQSHIDLLIEQRTKEAEANKARAEAEQKRKAEQESLQKTQDEYLFALEAEKIKLKEGEEAYLRFTLAKREFSDETIRSAIALRSEITELSEAQRLRDQPSKDKPQGDMAGRNVSLQAPGQVQGAQARFITRGIGMSGQDKILEATRKQIEKQEALLAEQKKQTQLLQDRLPREAY